MEVINVVRKYIIQDLTGLVEKYYVQEIDSDIGIFGCWKKVEDEWGGALSWACEKGHLDIVKKIVHPLVEGCQRRGWLHVGQERYDTWIHYGGRFGIATLDNGILSACRYSNNIHVDVIRYLVKQKEKLYRNYPE